MSTTVVPAWHRGAVLPAFDTHGGTSALDGQPILIAPAPGALDAPALPCVRPDWRLGLPVLHGDGVTLREPTLDDAGSLSEHLSNEEVAQFMSRPPSSAAAFERFITWVTRERHAGRCVCFGIVPPGHDHAVGLIQVRVFDAVLGTAEWGFALGPRYWGSGLFMKSATLLLDFAFREMTVHRLEARSSTANGRGNGVLRKVGAVQEGVLRQSLAVPNAQIDQILWSLLPEDWLPAHPEPAYRWLTTTTPAPLPAAPAASPRSPADLPEWRRVLPALRGSRCTLREIRVADAPTLYALLADPMIQRFLPPSPPTVAAVEQYARWAHRQREEGRHLSYALVPDGQEEIAGLFQLRQAEAGFRIAEWGFVLSQAYWGRGLFLEGARLLLDFAFDVLSVHRLEARVALGNGRGHGALQKVGAVREGRLRQSFLVDREYVDDALWALLAEDWRTCPQRHQATA